MNLKLIKGMRIVVATHNPGKVPEISALLGGDYEIVTAGQLNLPEPDETETTFAGNAMLKARHAAERSGEVSLADDSGLSVAALDGAPGIFSRALGRARQGFRRRHEQGGAAAGGDRGRRPHRLVHLGPGRRPGPTVRAWWWRAWSMAI